MFWKGYVENNHVRGNTPLNDANIANEVRLIEVYLADKVWDLVELAYMDQR